MSRIDTSGERLAPGVVDLQAIATLVSDCAAKIAAAEGAMAKEVDEGINDRKALRVQIQDARRHLLALSETVEKAMQASDRAEKSAGVAAAGVQASAEDIGRLMAALASLAAIVGQPGDPAAAAKLSLSDMTIAEAEKAMNDAALGSGLCRWLAEDRVRDAQRDRRMVKAAASTASTGTAVKTTGGVLGGALALAFANDPVAFLHGVASIGWPGVALLALLIIGGAVASRRKAS
jgi:hypothetical protein